MKSFEQNLENCPPFSPGDAVYALNFSRHGARWVPGVILATVSPINFHVQVDETTWKRHRNQLRPRSIPGAMLPEMKPQDELLPQSSNSEPLTSASGQPAVTEIPTTVVDSSPAMKSIVNDTSPDLTHGSVSTTTPVAKKQPTTATTAKKQPQRNAGIPLRYHKTN